MPGSPDPAEKHDPLDTVPRFGPGFRILHWVHAAPFLFLLVSGLTLFVQPLKAMHIDGFRVVPLLHVAVGLAFIASPAALFVLLRADRAIGNDLRLLFRIRRDDWPWAGYAIGAVLGARVQPSPVGKFNLGQKLNAGFTVLVTLALMLTGAVLAVNFFTKQVFDATLVERVYSGHDFFMLLAIPVVALHIYVGSLNPSTRESLRGILTGRVSRTWARSHHPTWLEEIDARETPESRDVD